MRRSPVEVAGCIAVALLLSVRAAAQETTMGAELRRERERIAEKCREFSFAKIADCAATFVTDHPFHVAVGSIAPQNGFGAGLAFVAPQWKPNEDWRINWSADAVGTPSGAWRAGAYARFVSTRVTGITATGPGGGTPAAEALPRPYPAIAAYGQVTSLPTVFYFGLGNDTARTDRTAFEIRQWTVGTRLLWPIARSGFFNRLNPIALGMLNGRWVKVAGRPAGATPSIDTRFTDAAAPGLNGQPATLELGEGVRIAPAIGRLQLTYALNGQQFIAPSDSSASFRRWTVDLRHEFSIWTTSRQTGIREHNGPNECAASVNRIVGEYGCPSPTLITTNREGTVGFRALVSRSGVGAGSRVPFYFQPTIGGSDIDGERILASYDDYRFRAPNHLVFQETIEQAVWGPIGAFAAAEQGRVALIHDSLSQGTLHKTWGAGLTLRAGGVPMVTIWWADGGSEGHHIAVTMSTSLLGGSSRPSLR
jgi:hypothetical protein